MDLNNRQLRYFLEVVGKGTVTDAAAALFITVPSLSEQLSKLQKTLGFRLFIKDGRRLTLTNEGEIFAQEVRGFLVAHNRVIELIDSLRKNETNLARTRLRLGFVPGMVGQHTPAIIKTFQARNPDIELILSQMEWGNQVEPVLAGRLEAALVRGPVEAGDALITPVLREPRAVVMARGNPSYLGAEMQISDLAGLTQVAAGRAPASWGSWWAIDPRPDGTRAKFGQIVNSVEEMLQVVAATNAVCFTPLSFKDVFPREDVVYATLIDAEPTEVGLLTSPRSVVPGLESLIEVFREYLGVPTRP